MFTLHDRSQHQLDDQFIGSNNGLDARLGQPPAQAT